MTKLKKESVPFAFIYQSNREAGFTLVELAVVIVIIGLLATMGLSALNVQLASTAISSTKKKQDTIKDALIAYLGRNSRLPCPDSDVTPPDGIENRGTTGTPTVPANPSLTCNTNFGIVPYQTLGLPKSAALDGWENYFSYQVSNDTASAPNLDWTLTNNFHTGNTGVITVKDRNSADLINIVAVVVSYGQDGLGAYTSKGTRNVLPDFTTQPDEYQNTQNLTPRIFYRREYTENASVTGGTFDDILLALNPNDILTPLIKDGSMKSPEAQWAEQYIIIKNWAVDQVLSNCKVSALPANLAIGPWGESVTFNPSTTNPFRFTDTVSPHTPAASFLYSISDPNVSLIPNGPTAGQLLGAYPYLISKCP